MNFKISSRRRYYCWLIAFSVNVLACDDGLEPMPCEEYTEPFYTPISGNFEIEYNGSLGLAPRTGYHLHEKTETEEWLEIRGCHGGEDYWYVALHFRVPLDAERPVIFDMDELGMARAAAFLRIWPGHDPRAPR